MDPEVYSIGQPWVLHLFLQRTFGLVVVWVLTPCLPPMCSHVGTLHPGSTLLCGIELGLGLFSNVRRRTFWHQVIFLGVSTHRIPETEIEGMVSSTIQLFMCLTLASYLQSRATVISIKGHLLVIDRGAWVHKAVHYVVNAITKLRDHHTVAARQQIVRGIWVTAIGRGVTTRKGIMVSRKVVHMLSIPHHLLIQSFSLGRIGHQLI